MDARQPDESRRQECRHHEQPAEASGVNIGAVRVPGLRRQCDRGMGISPASRFGNRTGNTAQWDYNANRSRRQRNRLISKGFKRHRNVLPIPRQGRLSSFRFKCVSHLKRSARCNHARPHSCIRSLGSTTTDGQRTGSRSAIVGVCSSRKPELVSYVCSHRFRRTQPPRASSMMVLLTECVRRCQLATSS